MNADRSTVATRAPLREMLAGHFCCGRCGIVKRYHVSRGRPAMCRDCIDVERGTQ